MTNELLILEGIVTTVNADQTVNISPMGPMVDRQLSRMRLRPFKTSRTYTNLKRHGVGVFHVTDDVWMMARCAVGAIEPPPAMQCSEVVDGRIITSACRWYAFRARNIDDQHDRTTIDCEVVDAGRQRDFFGFNRAKHAVVEAAILATRIHLTSANTLNRQFDELAVLVEKTGGDQERQAFDFLRQYVRQHAPPTETASE